MSSVFETFQQSFKAAFVYLLVSHEPVGWRHKSRKAELPQGEKSDRTNS